MITKFLVSKFPVLLPLLFSPWLISSCAQPAHVQLRNDVMRLAAQGRFGEAREAAEKALRSAEETLGPEHPTVAFDLHNLAEFNKNEALLSKDEATRQRAAANAESMFKRALAIREKTIGVRNSLTVDTMIGLADTYILQRRYDEAEALYKRALETLKEFVSHVPILQHLEQRAKSGLGQIEKERKK